MSNTESFIDEVAEEVRRERVFLLLRRYGWIGVVVVLGVVGGAAWNEWQKSQTRERSEAFGGAVMAALDAGDPAAAQSALQSIEAKGDASALTRLLAAGEALGSDDPALRSKGLADLAAVSSDPSVSQIWQDLATLRRVTAPGGSDLSPTDRAAALQGLANAGRPFRPLAVEQLALDKIAAGDEAGALADFRALLEDREAPSALRARAQQMIVVLGGETLPVQN